MRNEIKGIFPVTIVLSYSVAIEMVVYAVMIYNNFFESIATTAMVLIIILAVIYCVSTTLLFLRNAILEHVYIWLSTFIGVIMLVVELSQGFKFSPLMVYGMIICLIFLGFNIFMHANYYVNTEFLAGIFNSAPRVKTIDSSGRATKKPVSRDKIVIKTNVKKKK